MSLRVVRFDGDGTVNRKLRRTAQGGIVTDARPTRVGILDYLRPDGTVVRELRPPEEVFDPASLATLSGAPLTVAHPAGGTVTSANWSSLSKGHVCDDVRAEGNLVAATVRVQDADTVRMIESGKLIELSAGYTAVMDPTPGVWNGQPYDEIQRTIRYDHVALLPAGGGRAGRDVCLRMDAVEHLDAVERARMSFLVRMTDMHLDPAGRAEAEQRRQDLAAGMTPRELHLQRMKSLYEGPR